MKMRIDINSERPGAGPIDWVALVTLTNDMGKAIPPYTLFFKPGFKTRALAQAAADAFVKAHPEYNKADPVPVKEYKCPDCSQIFTSQAALDEHTRLYHAQKFICTIDGQSFASQMDLNLHMSTVHGSEDEWSDGGEEEETTLGQPIFYEEMWNLAASDSWGITSSWGVEEMSWGVSDSGGWGSVVESSFEMEYFGFGGSDGDGSAW